MSFLASPLCLGPDESAESQDEDQVGNIVLNEEDEVENDEKQVGEVDEKQLINENVEQMSNSVIEEHEKSVEEAPARPSSVATIEDDLNEGNDSIEAQENDDVVNEGNLEDESKSSNSSSSSSGTLIPAEPSTAVSGLVPSKRASSLQLLHPSGGLNLKHYEDQMHQLKNENFRLKLRIHFLETDYGLLPNARSNDNENVYRINLDLRVAHETLKHEVESKTSLLKAAYEAMEEQEQERLRERNAMQSQIESLRQTMMESQIDFQQFNPKMLNSQDASFMTVKGAAPSRFLSTEEDDYCTRLDRESLLREAFGSINLGHVQQQNGSDQADKSDGSDGNNKTFVKDDVVKENEKKDQEVSELKKALEMKDEEILKLTEKDEARTEEIEAKQQEILHLQSELAKQSRDNEEETCQSEKQKQFEIDTLKESHQLKTLECERKSEMMDQMTQQLQNELDTLTNQLNSLRAENNQREAQFSAETQLYQTKLSSKMNDIANLQKEVDNLKLQNESLKDTKTKISQNLEIKERDMSVLQGAFDKLKVEYKRVKDIVRKQRGNSVCTTRSDDFVSEEPYNNRGSDKILQQQQNKTTPAAAEIGPIDRGQTHQFFDREALVQVAAQVLERARNEYDAAMDAQTSSTRRVVDALRKRLMELVSFLQRLLSDESNLSAMSDDFRDAMNKSMEESRRISMSLSRSLLAPLDEELTSTPAAEGGAMLDLSDAFIEVSPHPLPQIVFKPSELIAFATAKENEPHQCIDYSEEELQSELRKALEIIEILRSERLGLTNGLAQIKHELETKTKQIMKELGGLQDLNVQLQQAKSDLEKEKEASDQELNEVKENKNALESELERAEIELYETRRELERVIQDNKERFDQMEVITNERVMELEKQTEMLNEAKTRLEMRLIKARSEPISTIEESTEEPTSSVANVLNKSVASDENKENINAKEVNVSMKRVNSNMCCECQQRVYELERLLDETKALLAEAQATIDREQKRKEALERRAKRELSKTKMVLKTTRKM